MDMNIVELSVRNSLAVRYRTSMADLSKSMGQVYGEIAAFMAKKGIAFAGPPFAMYYNMDMDDLDLEIGFPVASAVASALAATISGEGRVKVGQLPGGKLATATHIGAYDGIAETYERLTAFVAEKGLKPEDFMYEEYLNSPEDTPPEKLATNIYFPLKA